MVIAVPVMKAIQVEVLLNDSQNNDMGVLPLPPSPDRTSVENNDGDGSIDLVCRPANCKYNYNTC